MQLDSIICIGDSITQRGFEKHGWVSQLSHLYIRKLQVINQGYSGYNSKWLLPLLPTILATNEPKKLIIIFIGANDAVMENVSQHVPLSQFKSNIETMVTLSRKKCKNVMLVAPPPIIEKDWKTYRESQPNGTLDRTLQHVKQYNNAIVTLSSNSLPVFDPWKLMDNQPSFFCDGLHFSEAGNTAFGKEIIGFIKQTFPELDETNLQYKVKDWKEIREGDVCLDDLLNY